MKSSDDVLVAFRSETESVLGRSVVRIAPVVGGHSSKNWCVTADGGRRYLFKWAGDGKRANLAKTFSMLQVPAGGLVPRPVALKPFRGGWLLAMEWLDGAPVSFERLTQEQVVNFAAAYSKLSKAMQSYCGDVAPSCDGLSCPSSRLQVIHGDLNSGNVLFRGHDVAGFVDFEMVRRGLPTEDLVRGFIHRSERLSPFAFVARRRLAERFGWVVGASDYPTEDWLSAIRAYRLRKERQRLRRHRLGFVRWIEKLVREPFYRRLEGLVLVLAKNGREVRPLSAERHVPSPHAHLLKERPWERVGKGGSRRVCYKLGDSGFCVKFYKPEEWCDAEQKRKKKCACIKREIRTRRFDVRRNSSSQEVFAYESFWTRQSAVIREKLPPVVERVFDERLGWGILETYYTNPDGTAIVPYEDEIARQPSPEMRREIYGQAKAFLEELAKIAAPFYEPGNFHTLIRPDGGIETKLIDFEPVSKVAIPLVKFCPWLRRLTIRRKARHYLKHIREKYGIAE